MSISNPRVNPPSREGLLVLGTEAGCGKTALITGLAASLNEAGLRVQALKPLEFCTDVSFHKGRDQAYLNKITQQYMQVETLHAASPWEVTPVLWNRMIEHCKSLQYPCLLEGVGSVATPWQISNGEIVDGVDVALLLKLPVLLVAKADGNFLEKTRHALSFLQDRQATITGFIRVQTELTSQSSEEEALLISQHYSVPFLGELPYSPSISVQTLQQGNLIRLTQENIDLLPLQMGMGLAL
jgi:dethiobiotin synthetase